MPDNLTPPDYEIQERLALTAPPQVRAISNPLRTTILGLLSERAATVTEIATAVGRPKSTIAHHVKVLNDAGLVRVVRTRQVRAIEERFYGRTARLFYIALERAGRGEVHPADFNDFEVAAAESQQAFEERRLWAFIRHARLPETRAAEFWERIAGLVREFDELPRSGDTTFGFAVGIYPTNHPRLPDRVDP